MSSIGKKQPGICEGGQGPVRQARNRSRMTIVTRSLITQLVRAFYMSSVVYVDPTSQTMRRRSSYTSSRLPEFSRTDFRRSFSPHCLGNSSSSRADTQRHLPARRCGDPIPYAMLQSCTHARNLRRSPCSAFEEKIVDWLNDYCLERNNVGA